jgi:hypothetical protein
LNESKKTQEISLCPILFPPVRLKSRRPGDPAGNEV